MAETGFDLLVRARPQIERHELGRTLAQAVGDILPRDDQVLAGLIDAAQHDVRVRMLCVEVVDGDPVEPGTEALLDLRHQPPDIGLEVRIFGTVLGRDNEAKLVAIARCPLEEFLAVRAVGLRAIELAGQPLPGDPIALDVAHVCAGCLAALPGEAN